MRKLLIIATIIFTSCSFSIAQLTCCSSVKSTNGMNQFAADKLFISAHQSPFAFHYTAAAGAIISFSTKDGVDAKAYFVKAKAPTDNYLFVFHEWWGLNDYIKQRADELQLEIGNVNVIAIDMYDGKIATTADSAGALMSRVNEARLQYIINGAIKYAGKQAQIASIGWCFGGGLSLQATLLAGKNAVGCVMYYGMPITDVELLNLLNADVLGIFGTKDQWISPKVVQQFDKDMVTANKKLTIKNYDAEHAFANPSNPNFDISSAADANKSAVEFLKNCFY